MKRRAARRDAWLSARMLIVVVLLGAATVGAIAGAIGLLMLVSGIWVVYGLLVLYAVVALAVAQCRSASATMLRAVGARELLEDEEPELQAAVARLAAAGGRVSPKIAIAQLDRPNSLTVGVRPRNTTIVVSRGLLELLPPAERDAALAHELAHVLNRDAAVMSAALLTGAPEQLMSALQKLAAPGVEIPTEDLRRLGASRRSASSRTGA